MAMPGQGHTAANTRQARARTGPPTIPQPETGEAGIAAPDRDWLLDLANALHTTLEVEELVPLFAERLADRVPCHGAFYHEPEQGIAVSWGRAAGHACTYDLILFDRRLGYITFNRDTAFSDAEMQVLENVLCNLIHPLRNALMYRSALAAAVRDPLTEVNNRAGLNTFLEREVELARRHVTPLSLIMLDADRFKALNDTYGHLAGDCALKAMAQCVKACCRDSDLVFRYGGEEFVVVLSNTRLEGAVFLAERIRNAVENLSVRCGEEQLHLTVSLGVATFAGDDDSESLLARADEALYRSKAGGRNRVSAYPTEQTNFEPPPDWEPYPSRGTPVSR